MNRHSIGHWPLVYVLHFFVTGCGSAPPPPATIQKLYDVHPGKLVENITGIAGVTFFSPTDHESMVTHLGYFDAGQDGLQVNHGVALYEGQDNPARVLFEQVPFGEQAKLDGGYRWVRLAQPLRLRRNTYYTLVAEVCQGVGDPWPDVIRASGGGTAVPQWNESFVRVEEGTTPCPILSKKLPWPNYPDDLRIKRANSAFGAVSLGFDPTR